MISALVLTAFALSPPPFVATVPPAMPTPGPQDEATTDYTQEIEACGEDVAKLVELATAWKEAGKTKEAKAAWTRILEIDPEHEEAHRALRHHLYDGQWFKSYAELSRYRREEAQRMREKHGLVRHGDEWVLEADLPYLRMNWIKSEDGKWLSPLDLAREEAIAAFEAEGRQQRPQDGVWIHPDDFEKWTEGLWLCGEEWVSLEAANTFHGELFQWWQYQGERFVILATVEHNPDLSQDKLAWSNWYADQTYGDLIRIFGVQPTKKPEVLVFKNITQYNAFAGGDQAAQIPPNEASGFSSLHYAYFADSFYAQAGESIEYRGTGVAYWDYNDAALAGFGQHSIRHAAGLAYLEAIDPSWVTISEAITAQSPPDQNAFWEEKKIPRWLRYGAASYVGRYFEDANAQEPMWARNWAISNLGEEIDPIETILAFNLTLEDIPGSTKLINEGGLVVAFMLDGGCAAVSEKHGAFKAALLAGEGIDEALTALQTSLVENEAQLRAFAGL